MKVYYGGSECSCQLLSSIEDDWMVKLAKSRANLKHGLPLLRRQWLLHCKRPTTLKIRMARSNESSLQIAMQHDGNDSKQQQQQ